MDNNSIIPYNWTLNKRTDYVNYLKSNADLSFFVIDNITIVNKEAVQSIFNGSVFKDSTLIKLNLKRSDFNAVRFENTTLREIDFSSSDIQSTYFSNCTIIDCNFSDALISDCTFTNVQFINCSFAHSGFSNSIINKSLVKKADFECSTVVLNKFYDTVFEDTCLGNTTFMFHILKRCVFNNVSMNSDSIAYLYGLSLQDLQKFEFIFLGKKIEIQPIINVQFLRDLINTFLQKHWMMGAVFIGLNYNLYTPYQCLNEIIRIINGQCKFKQLIKKDEIEFLKYIINELKEEKRLPVLGIELIIDGIANIQMQESDINRNILYNLYHFCSMIKDEVESYIIQVQDDLFNEEYVDFELVFKERPNVNVNNFLNRISSIVKFPLNIYRERQGSFILEGSSILLSLLIIAKTVLWLTGNAIKIYKDYIECKKQNLDLRIREKLVDNLLNKEINFDKDSLDAEKRFFCILKQEPEIFSELLSNNNSGFQKDNFVQINIFTSKVRKSTKIHN